MPLGPGDEGVVVLLIHRPEGGDSAGNRAISIDDLNVERKQAGGVAGELGAQEALPDLRIAEACRGPVQRDDPAAVVDERLQRPLLLRVERIAGGVEEEDVRITARDLRQTRQ